MFCKTFLARNSQQRMVETIRRVQALSMSEAVIARKDDRLGAGPHAQLVKQI
jgi:hypothetical protein